MSTIAKLAVEISAKSTKLKAGLATAHAKIQAFTKTAINNLKTIGTALSTAFAAGVGAVIATVESYAEKIDKLAKTSNKLGTTVSALQKLQYQAGLTGVGANTLNTALQRMVRRISEVSSSGGKGTAAGALAELNLNAKKLAKLSPEKQFYAISAAMQSIGSQGDKVRLAMKIFDTEGVALVNTMNSNLAQTGAEFESLGISISQSQARMVESYNDSKTKLSAIFSGFGAALTAELATPFQKTIEWITESIQKMGGMQQVAQGVATAFVEAFGAIVQAGAEVIRIFQIMEKYIKLIINGWRRIYGFAAKGIGKVFDIDIASELGDILENQADQADKEIQNLEKKIKESQIRIDNIKSRVQDAIESVGGGLNENGETLIKPEHYKAFDTAAEKASVRATADQKAAEKTNALASAAQKAASALSREKKGAAQKQKAASALPRETKGTAQETIASSYSKIGGLNSGLSGVSGAGGITGQFAVETATGQAAKRATEQSGQGLGKINLNMVTNAGEIAGEIFGQPAFLAGLKSFSDQQANNSAKAATI